MTLPTVLGLCVLVACVACVVGYVVGRAFGDVATETQRVLREDAVHEAASWRQDYQRLLRHHEHAQRHRLTTIYIAPGVDIIDALTGTTTSPEPEL